MPRGCLTSARYSMTCDIIKASGAPVNTETGAWTYKQDPNSGAIIRVWEDDLTTPGDESQRLVIPSRLSARGILDGGIRVAGTTERFSEVYQNIDWVKATFPKGTSITKRDQVRNIRTVRTGEVVWKEEEMTGAPDTLFNVMGVMPVMDPFSNIIEYDVLLQRSEVQAPAPVV